MEAALSFRTDTVAAVGEWEQVLAAPAAEAHDSRARAPPRAAPGRPRRRRRSRRRPVVTVGRIRPQKDPAFFAAAARDARAPRRHPRVALGRRRRRAPRATAARQRRHRHRLAAARRRPARAGQRPRLRPHRGVGGQPGDGAGSGRRSGCRSSPATSRPSATPASNASRPRPIDTGPAGARARRPRPPSRSAIEGVGRVRLAGRRPRRRRGRCARSTACRRPRGAGRHRRRRAPARFTASR